MVRADRVRQPGRPERDRGHDVSILTVGQSACRTDIVLASLTSPELPIGHRWRWRCAPPGRDCVSPRRSSHGASASPAPPSRSSRPDGSSNRVPPSSRGSRRCSVSRRRSFSPRPVPAARKRRQRSPSWRRTTSSRWPREWSVSPSVTGAGCAIAWWSCASYSCCGAPGIGPSHRGDADPSPAHHAPVRSAVSESITRYGETEPRIHAFARYDAESALLLDAALAATGAPGTLARVPVGVKDIFDTAGALTERGSALYAGRIAERDADVVRNLRAAGAVIVGKTVTAELAFYHPGPTRNPWDLSRTPGGSSMGSAAAVAAGGVPLAVGGQNHGAALPPAAFSGPGGV